MSNRAKSSLAFFVEQQQVKTEELTEIFKVATTKKTKYFSTRGGRLEETGGNCCSKGDKTQGCQVNKNKKAKS